MMYNLLISFLCLACLLSSNQANHRVKVWQNGTDTTDEPTDDSILTDGARDFGRRGRNFQDEPPGNVRSIYSLYENCGLYRKERSRTGKKRIIGGKDALPGEIPSAVKVLGLDGTICGGSIIHNSYVLTAAHCLTDGKRFEAKGVYTTIYGDKYHEIDNVCINKKFQSEKMKFDMAIIILKENLEFNLYVEPVCVPKYPGDEMSEYNKVNTFVGSFGSTGSGKFPDRLQVIWVYEDNCKVKLAENICFRHDNETASICYGDSGSGFIYYNTKNGVTRQYLGATLSRATGDCKPIRSYSVGINIFNMREELNRMLGACKNQNGPAYRSYDSRPTFMWV